MMDQEDMLFKLERAFHKLALDYYLETDVALALLEELLLLKSTPKKKIERQRKNCLRQLSTCWRLVQGLDGAPVSLDVWYGSRIQAVFDVVKSSVSEVELDNGPTEITLRYALAVFEGTTGAAAGEPKPRP